ncbi:MAG: SIS domain-containing protein [Bdellovibrio sp.]|jgi:arabinose-5-phosphate isomerase
MHDPISLAKTVFETEAQAILSLRERLNESFVRAVGLIVNCQGKVILTGIGKSGQIARKVASTFSSTGTPAIYLHPSESSHGDLGVVRPEDVVIAMSYGGNSVELGSILSFLARKGNPLIAITGNLQSDLALKAQAVLDVKVNKEACPLGLAPTASSTATLAMGDALAMAVLDQKGFSSDDFAQNHPGGGLGFKLARVRDLMHTGSSLPVLTESTPVKQVVTVMSRGDVRGAAGIVDDRGDLLGIITDGDIRRRLDAALDPLAGAAGALMTKNPRTIDASEIAERALFMMEQFRIQVLFVLDKAATNPRQPVGVIHIQDLLQAKVR